MTSTPPDDRPPDPAFDPAFDRALRESAARLRSRAGSDVRTDAPAPERLWDAVAGRLDEDERLRVLDVALRTERGRRELALLRTASAAADEAFPGARARAWWARPGLAAAAAALLVVGVGGSAWWSSGGDRAPVDVLRAGEQSASRVALAAGDVRMTEGARLRWHAVPGAIRYDVEVLGAEGAVLQAAGTPDTSVALTPRLALPPGGAEWWVRARMPDGSTRRSAWGRVVAR